MLLTNYDWMGFLLNVQYDAGRFSLKNTLECGQCFRWKENKDGSFSGVVGSRELTLRQDDTVLTFYDTSEQEFEQIWKPYFDLDTDYASIYKILCEDNMLREACAYTGEIHILRQDSWEGLCSFIISQNNNIPRIKGIIDRLCSEFGTRLFYGGYSFPRPERLIGLGVDDLAGIRAGFRSKYILDAAEKVASGSIDFSFLQYAEIQEAQNALMKISGVGPKVAECALLFGCHRLEAFPVDVWIKRVLSRFYQQGFPEFAKPYGGIAQQILFHYVRCCKECIA